jgi:hypothetical protein
VRPLGGGAIDGSDLLGIAQGTIDRCRIDGDLRARSAVTVGRAGMRA